MKTKESRPKVIQKGIGDYNSLEECVQVKVKRAAERLKNVDTSILNKTSSQL